jgi:predicted ATP-grasp superfamily ATP-dependent carboligase
MTSLFNKSIFLLAFIAFTQILLTNATPIVQSNEVTPSPPSPSPPKVECDRAKKVPLNETATATMPAPLMDKTIKSTVKPPIEHIGHIFIEPIGNGKEAIIIPEYIHGADHHKSLSTGMGTTTPTTTTAALLAAKKQAILNEPITKGYPDYDDWDTDLPRQHYHSHFNRYNDRLSNCY